MKVEFSKEFIKTYHKRFRHQGDKRVRFEERTRLFSRNRFHPSLKDHPLVGDKTGLRSFSITGDIRVIYYIHEEIAYFTDIGTHNQVY
jgi:addiction module RelE/StbE family toxin